MGDQVLPEQFSVFAKQCAWNDCNFSENTASFCTTTTLLHTQSPLYGHFLQKTKFQLFHSNPTALLSQQQNSSCS